MKQPRTFPKNADLGAAAEQFAAAECLLQGYKVNWSTSDKLGYDFVLDINGKLRKVQVKGLFTKETSRNRYSADLRRGGSKHKSKVKYLNKEVDFFIIYIYPLDTFYVVPWNVMKGKTKFTVTDGASTYDGYKEAWHLLG